MSSPHVETSVKQADEHLRAVIDTLPIAVARCNRDLRYVWVSRAYAEWIGRELGEIEGRPIADVLGPAAGTALARHFAAVMAGERVAFEEEIAFQGIGSRWVSGVYTPMLDESGNVDGWLATVLDITDRKNLEQALRNAVRRKDDFLATLAHELRNPLAPIRHAVLQLARSDVTAERRGLLHAIIDRASLQLERLLDDLLQISRIKRGVLTLRKTKSDLRAAVATAVEAVQPKVESKRQALRLESSANPVWVHGDPARLVQIFTNLLTNAVKFTPEDGHIEVSIQVGSIAATVIVRDDGIGIDAQNLPEIFETFMQVPGAATASGLGIGLNITKSLVGLHDGKITVESDGLGTGTRVTVQLPLLEEDAPVAAEESRAAAEESRAAAGAAGGPRRVLIVDDNVDAGESLGMLLESEGHRVRVVYDAKSCIPTALEFRPDVVLLDIGLPDINGYDLAAQIRAQRWDNPMVLVAVTGWGQPADKERAFLAGFDEHLTKPADFEALRRVLARAVPNARTH